MQISCPHCSKVNRFPIDKIGNKPICGSCGKELLSLPITANPDNFIELVSQKSLPVLVDFWAPWCGPCKIFGPTFQVSASQHANCVIYVKVDTEAHPDLGRQYNIRSIPTLAGLANGKEVNRVSGALPSSQLEQFVGELINQHSLRNR